jgi:heterodisulfide reductase subunit B
MKVTYYPGCSLEGTARDYADSIQGVCASLAIDLEEIPDWNCCGATAAHSVDHKAGLELPGRNLKLAAKVSNPDMLVPCPLCFNRLKAAVWALQAEEDRKDPVRVDSPIPTIWDLANFLAREEMLNKIKAGVRKPIEGLRVVCYYGCLASRPPQITGASDWESPRSLDRIIESLGGKPIPWPLKTDCCGASLMISRPDMGFRMVGQLYEMAQRVGAQAMVVSCQMCQANLDMYQDRIEAEWGRPFGLPVLYFTELIGLTSGLRDVKDWLSRHFKDPRPLLRELDLLAE